MRKITEIIVHCSDSPQGRGDDVNTIRRWHIERGFTDIGYHYVICENGVIQSGRQLEQNGAHCEGHNAESIGICLIGKETFTQQQFIALNQLVKDLKLRFPGIRKISGHRDYNPAKTCPNFEVKEKVNLDLIK